MVAFKKKKEKRLYRWFNSLTIFGWLLSMIFFNIFFKNVCEAVNVYL